MAVGADWELEHRPGLEGAFTASVYRLYGEPRVPATRRELAPPLQVNARLADSNCAG